MSNLSNSSEEPHLEFQRIGAGSFAVVYTQSGTRAAYKQSHRASDSDAVLAEYRALDKIYILCNSDSFFNIPRALVYYNPQSDVFLTQMPSPTNASRRRNNRPALKRETLVTFENAVYAMERIWLLPGRLTSAIVSSFYPPQHRNQVGPRLCRLYFGKVIDGERPSRFFNSANFPLDTARYEALGASEGLEPVQDVVYGMGEMLGRIHSHGGFDARDIEFVLGGDGFDGHTFHVIDFNQMRSWSKTMSDISVLVDAHYVNDPYYPRARPTDPLYIEFRRGYMDAYPQHEECSVIATAFLEAIEKKQADAATSNSIET